MAAQADGLKIEEPPLFIPWTISEYEFADLFGFKKPTRLFRGSYRVDLVALSGLPLKVCFRFDDYRLASLELHSVGKKYPGLEGSFRIMQKHLESTYGAPTKTSPGTKFCELDLPSYEWTIPGALIEHRIADHFGPYESTSIYTEVGRQIYFPKSS